MQKEIKKVLIVTKEYKCNGNENVGGTGVFYRNLCEEFVKRDVKPFVFLISKKKFKTVENGVTVYSVKDIFKSNFALETLRSLSGKVKFLEKLHYRIHLHEKKVIAGKIKKWIKEKNLHFDAAETHDWDGLALAIPQHIPLAIRCHGSWTVLKAYFGYKNVHKGRIFCEKKAIENCRNIITISKFNDKINRNLFNIDKTHLIYNGIDADFFRADSEIKTEEQSVFYLGNVSFEKGAETLLKEFVELRKTYRMATLHFVGKPNHYPEFIKQKMNDDEVKNAVFFHGSRNAAEVTRLLNRGEVVCFPSKGENFSLSLLEAMAIGKPIVCSDIESFREIIKDSENGMIAEENSFHKKIAAIFDDQIFAEKLGENARKTIEKDFTLDKMVTETLGFYKTMI